MIVEQQLQTIRTLTDLLLKDYHYGFQSVNRIDLDDKQQIVVKNKIIELVNKL